MSLNQLLKGPTPNDVPYLDLVVDSLRARDIIADALAIQSLTVDNLAVTGNTSLGTDATDQLNVPSNSTFSGPVSISGDLALSGAVTSTQTLGTNISRVPGLYLPGSSSGFFVDHYSQTGIISGSLTIIGGGSVDNPQTYEIRAVRLGAIVSLTFADSTVFAVTAGNVFFRAVGAIPVDFLPPANRQAVMQVVQNGSLQPGLVQIKSNGDVDFYPQTQGTSWSAPDAGNFWNGVVITYPLV